MLFPFPHLSPTLAPAQKKEQIEAVKAKRRALLKQFVQPGQPGQRHASPFLSSHPHTGSYAAEYATLLAQVLPLGAFVLLRSFYELILHAEQSGRPFALCFRTFGEDLETIFAEWNAFCDSKHPLFPAYCSNAASLPHRPDRRLTHAQVGAFVRYGSLPSECCLVMGTHRQPSLADLQRQTIEEFYQGHNVSILRGFPEIDGFLQAAFRAQRTLALRDYYPWYVRLLFSFSSLLPRWAANSERYDSGKLVFIPEQDSDPERPLVRYFDDNLRAEELVQKKQLIADLRDPSALLPPLRNESHPHRHWSSSLGPAVALRPECDPGRPAASDHGARLLHQGGGALRTLYRTDNRLQSNRRSA